MGGELLLPQTPAANSGKRGGGRKPKNNAFMDILSFIPPITQKTPTLNMFIEC